MKKIVTLFLIIGLNGCGTDEPSNNTNVVSTVDSSAIAPADASQSPLLHIDSHRVDTSFPIAMDSAGPTILAEDTVYNQD